MAIEDYKVKELKDLIQFRVAPNLNKQQSHKLFNEALDIISQADWLTIGIMAPSIEIGIKTLREIELKLKLEIMKCIDMPTSTGPVFLKANQRTGEIYARIEYGIGEGILISCQNYDSDISAETIGPLPLGFFE